jgi:hypothetical protein
MHAHCGFRAWLRLVAVIALTAGYRPIYAAANSSSSPTVSFTLDFPGANPSHYVIAVGRDGHGSYLSNGRISDDAPATDPVPLDFALSDHVRDQIFELVQRAHYFSGKVDSGRKNIANTGTKTLAYQDGQHQGQATFNYSTNVPVEQLTTIFQGLSETLEFGRRLSFLHRYQKTALDDDLKRMEELERENSLEDVQTIAPVLKQIADDPSVMNIARARALRLMATAGK